jgi:5-methylcytosine-specific restriction endonuclease McrA
MSRSGINPRTRKMLYRYFNHMCQYCNSSRAETLDHIVPVSKGGSRGVQNTIPSCYQCNQEKDNILLSSEKRRELNIKAQEAVSYVLQRHETVNKHYKHMMGKSYRVANGLER